MIYTTLNRIKSCNPSALWWNAILSGIGKEEADDDLLSFKDIADKVGRSQAMWCCRAEPSYESTWRLFAVWCVRRVKHLVTNESGIRALDIAEKNALGEQNDVELENAMWEAWKGFGEMTKYKHASLACVWASQKPPRWRGPDSACIHSAMAVWADTDSEDEYSKEIDIQYKEFIRIVTETD